MGEKADLAYQVSDGCQQLLRLKLKLAAAKRADDDMLLVPANGCWRFGLKGALNVCFSSEIT